MRQDPNPFHTSLPSNKLESALAGGAFLGTRPNQTELANNFLQSGYGGSTSQQ